jgi:hypothetical protein
MNAGLKVFLFLKVVFAWSDGDEPEDGPGGGEPAGDLQFSVHQLCLILKLLVKDTTLHKVFPHLRL